MNQSILLLEHALEHMNLSWNPAILEQYEQYMEMTLEKNQVMNLTAITDPEEFVIKHFIDSLMCADFKGMEMANRIIDIGTGAGFPGIPLAILFPEKEFVLVDSLNKRVKFLTEVVDALGLSNVAAIHSRAEELGMHKNHREVYDFCVSRAVAKMSLLAEYCLPFVKVGGYFAAYKSNQIAEEIKEAAKAIGVLGGKIETEVPFKITEFQLEHQILYIKKVAATPSKFPRKPGTASKDPIK